MHSRWPHGTAGPRPGSPGRVPPAPAGPRRAGGVQIAGPLAGLAAAAMLLAGCGHSASPSATKTVSHPAVQCGSSKTPANVPVKIEVAKGKVACSDALAIEKSYTTAVAQGHAPGNGRGPVTISGWTCQAFTTPVSLKTGNVSACYRSGTEILAVLPPP